MLQNISKLFNVNNKYKTEEHTIPDNLRSKELEWKLALLVRNVDNVEDMDLQFVKMTKINKVDLAPYVNVDLEQMKQDVNEARNGLPYIFGEMKNNNGIEKISDFLTSQGGL